MSMPQTRTFSGAHLARLRGDRNWSQTRAALETGVPLDTLRDYERGRTKPSVDRLVQIATGLDVTLDAFFQDCT